jgi:transposase
MPRTRNPYPAEFREQIIALARNGRSIESLAHEFEPCTADPWLDQTSRSRWWPL